MAGAEMIFCKGLQHGRHKDTIFSEHCSGCSVGISSKLRSWVAVVIRAV